jgi:ribosome assembly protein 1
MLRDFDDSIDAGFQMATFQGPLCAEPVVGMAFVVEEISYHKEEGDEGGFAVRSCMIADVVGRGRSSAIVGALISSVRDACRSGLLDWSPRIKLAMYTCDIQASSKSAWWSARCCD